MRPPINTKVGGVFVEEIVAGALGVLMILFACLSINSQWFILPGLVTYGMNIMYAGYIRAMRDKEVATLMKDIKKMIEERSK